jgi:hypothetical protein
VKYELGFYNPVDGILHSYRRENRKSYRNVQVCGYKTAQNSEVTAPFAFAL